MALFLLVAITVTAAIFAGVAVATYRLRKELRELDKLVKSVERRAKMIDAIKANKHIDFDDVLVAMGSEGENLPRTRPGIPSLQYCHCLVPRPIFGVCADCKKGIYAPRLVDIKKEVAEQLGCEGGKKA